MKKMSAVSAADLDRMKKTYLQNEKARVVRNALTTNDIASISRVLEASAASPNMFSIDIKTMRDIGADYICTDYPDRADALR